MSGETMVLFQVRVPVALRESLRARAKALDLRVSDVARYALSRECQLGQDELTRLRGIAQRARKELARAKPGSTLWEALRFILSPPIKGTEIVGKAPTWESLGRGYVDHPEPDQTYGCNDG